MLYALIIKTFFNYCPGHALSQVSIETAILFLNHYSIQCDWFELGKQLSCLHLNSSTRFTLDQSGDLDFPNWYTFHNSLNRFVLNGNLWNGIDMNIKWSYKYNSFSLAFYLSQRNTVYFSGRIKCAPIVLVRHVEDFSVSLL